MHTDRVTPHTEKLIQKVVASFAEKQKAEASAANAADVYRADLLAALDTGERGVQAELARRLGRSRDALRLDANEDARHARIARRTKAA